MKLVAVYWTDTCGNDDRTWLTMCEVKEITACPMVTVGYLISDEGGYLLMAGTKSVTSVDDAYGNVNAIPLTCVKEVVELCDNKPCRNNSVEKI
tara:strand:+ start:448 stop:729 length:282 start_codon:yes stop_codon:yes gene_type:complete